MMLASAPPKGAAYSISEDASMSLPADAN